jgi:UDP-3-O-[3-hydroxymyristoyl] glucosamine N-acyltransferase
VAIGRHCLLAAQIGLAGSLTIGDNVVVERSVRDKAADLKGEGQE